MAYRAQISYSRQESAYERKKPSLAARTAWAIGLWTVGAVLVLLLALGFIVLEEGLDTLSTAAADSVPTTMPTPIPTVIPTATAVSNPAVAPAREYRPITRVRDKDGAVMVFVPAGEFWMGSDENDPKAGPLESPRHKVGVGAFWIDRTEVTNAQFRQCVDAGPCGPPQKTSSLSRIRYYKDPEYADYPVVNVTWYQARAYATWAGGRLPSEAEWEYAARGPEGATYPWGEDAPNEGLLNYNFYLDDTTPVGSYPAGASWCGALDMSGSVWEWTSSLYRPYPYDAADGREDLEAEGRRVLRGGAFAGGAAHVRSATRALPAPGYWDWLGGFRVVQPSP
jgi:formylglycine-generating enzyme required for sulfatase activity